MSPIQGQPQSILTCQQLHKKAERIAAAILADKAKLKVGDNVALVYPPGLDLITAFYGCLYAGKLNVKRNERFVYMLVM